MPHVYETDGAAIYRQSFATIRSEADLARFTPDEEPVVVRMIHAAGMVGLEAHVRFTPGMAASARAALQNGAPILCDARMVSEGITRARLPAGNAVICTLGDPQIPALVQSMRNTRSAAALELWRPHLAGAIVAIGNAPTALFHLLNNAGGCRLSTAGGDHRLSGRLRRCRRIQGGIDGCAAGAGADG
ncbi:precorrin isomerase [Bradyrhizobium sp. USDA 4011]